jgi:hypothetical protein
LNGKEVKYIGETGRKLGIRFKEHFYLNKDIEKRTEVCRHSTDTHGSPKPEDWELTILEKENREFFRISKEALWIKSTTGCINRSKGYQVMGL